jgi:tetratricopeptide (TPR) repeat protein
MEGAMPPQPATIADDIIDQINKLHRAISVRPSQFELSRLDFAIKKLENVDVDASLSFRGVYYALQGDLENTQKWFELALRRSPNNPDTAVYYAMALSRLEQHEQAIDILLEHIKKYGNRVYSIDRLLMAAYFADNLAVLNEWLPKFESLTGFQHGAVAWLQDEAEDEADIATLRKDSSKGPALSLDQICKELEL